MLYSLHSYLFHINATPAQKITLSVCCHWKWQKWLLLSWAADQTKWYCMEAETFFSQTVHEFKWLPAVLRHTSSSKASPTPWNLHLFMFHLLVVNPVKHGALNLKGTPKKTCLFSSKPLLKGKLLVGARPLLQTAVSYSFRAKTLRLNCIPYLQNQRTLDSDTHWWVLWVVLVFLEFIVYIDEKY